MVSLNFAVHLFGKYKKARYTNVCTGDHFTFYVKYRVLTTIYKA